MLSLKQLSLRWKALIPVVGAIVVLAAVIFVVSQGIITKQAEGLALTKVQSDLALMFELLEAEFPGPWRVEGQMLYKGDHPVNGDTELVSTCFPGSDNHRCNTGRSRGRA